MIPKAERCTAATFRAALTPRRRVLGFDVGSKTIGLALSDITLTVASPLETIRRTKWSRDKDGLLALIETHEVTGYVIGLPVNMDGTSGPRVQATHAFASNLMALAPRPYLFWDERLSSAAVERTLIEADRSRARRSELIDKMAAAYILQGALHAI